MTLETDESPLVEDTASSSDLVDRDTFAAIMEVIFPLIPQANDKTELTTTIFSACEQYLRSPQIRSSTVSMSPTIAVYYLKAYKNVFSVIAEDKDETQLQNEAVIALYDVYANGYPGSPLRSCMVFLTGIFQQVLQQRLEQLEVTDTKAHIARVATTTMILSTVGTYLNAAKRNQNRPYIAWVKTFLERCLTDEELAFVDNDPTVTAVTIKLRNRQKLIKV